MDSHRWRPSAVEDGRLELESRVCAEEACGPAGHPVFPSGSTVRASAECTADPLPVGEALLSQSFQVYWPQAQLWRSTDVNPNAPLLL